MGRRRFAKAVDLCSCYVRCYDMAAIRHGYPPPWRIEKRRASYIVMDAMGKPLA
jgi:hypothetical protein